MLADRVELEFRARITRTTLAALAAAACALAAVAQATQSCGGSTTPVRPVPVRCTGEFTLPVGHPAGANPAALALADLDADGRVDVIAANAGSGRVSILWNEGDGAFAAPASLAAGLTPMAVAIDDLDGDGDLDAAVANDAAHRASILWNL